MPGTRFKQDSYVECPYYCKETPIEIKCKGICGTHTLQIFRSKKEKDDFKDNFCCSCFKGCPCYIQLDIDNE